ncbi:M23 family metallopeptidase [Jeotgalicoccus psychrophilus]|uniref:M23 family metallopeptidase n=1 Tax=Jeotgalicoccus psychrophilus TaxID=157228 RepID=UPI0003F90F74|nr:M23 family metallopeptidase [Jeotgalicoccus psychrophilus]
MRAVNETKINPDDFGKAFLKENPDVIYNQCVPSFQSIITAGQFTDMVNDFNQNVNSYYMKEKIQLGDLVHYIWLDDADEKAVSVYFDSDYYINKMIIKPYITYPESDSTLTEVAYSMPVNEECTVFWGGENEFVNYHYVYETQRYAYDLLMIENNSTYVNNQLRNENYFAFNKDVTAPAAGKVVKVVDHIKDNIPGEMNEAEPFGNYVIIQHESSEYSALAHFKLSSITVREGDTVYQGQIIGQCGNSGYSSETHIHFQVMDSPDINSGKSLRIRFADGIEPIQGDIVTQSIIKTSSKKKDKMIDTLDKADLFSSVLELLLYVPRLISQLIRAILS